MYTIPNITAAAITRMNSIRKGLIRPSRTNCTVVLRALGSRATIPAMITSEMPLPMPRSVICSPIHMTNIEPTVTVITVNPINAIPGE